MRAIIVDDDTLERELFRHQVKNQKNIEVVADFSSGEDALMYEGLHNVDVAVLDVEMDGINGIKLGEQLKVINPDMVFIYVTGHGGYALEAFKLQSCAYLLKPYTKDQLFYALESANLLLKRKKKRIYVKTFGHFDVFVDGKPILFKSAKAKELLAYLVDREGGSVSTDQIISILWEDRPDDEATQSLCSKAVKTLQKELKEYGAEDMLISARSSRCVNKDVFDCDLYDYLENKDKDSYFGEYMVDYSWAEQKNATLFHFDSI